MKCEKCGGDMILMSAFNVNFIPDSEPYKSGETKHIPIETDADISGYFCEKCNELRNLWAT